MSVDVVLCNLTRFGDLLQSQALIDDLHQAGKKVGLVCLENFASALPLLRHVDMSWSLPGARLMAQLDQFWPGATSQILSFVKHVRNDGKPGCILNLTPTLPARLLTKMLAASSAKMLGFGMDEFGYALNQGVWSSFLAVAAKKRLNSPFNLADLFRMIGLPLSAGLHGSFRLAEPPEQSVAWAKNFLESQRPGAASPDCLVAFQLGASADRRRWPVSSFRELGKRLWDSAGFIPVLLGSSSEAHLAEKYAREADHPFINAVGQTDISQLAALLRETRLLVTNDTGTMHLAAGQGVPSISFFLATAQPWDTGPLLPGSICLEPAMPCHPCAFGRTCTDAYGCRGRISAENAASLVLARLRGEDWHAALSPALLEQARVWLTGVDQTGMTCISPVRARRSEREAWLGKLRLFWRQLLDDMDGTTSGQDDTMDPAPASPDNDASILRDVAAKAVPCLENAAGILESLASLGTVAAKNPRAGQLLLRNTERLQITLDGCPPLESLAHFWRELRENRGGSIESFIPAATKFGQHCVRLASSLTKETK